MENIFRFVDEKGMPPKQATIEATREIGFAVLATTLSLLAVFVPVAFMTGMVGRFMSSFGLTAAFAIAVSLLVSFTLTPMLSSRWIDKGAVKAGASTERSLYHRIESGYLKLLEWSLRHRAVVVIVIVVTVLTTVPIVSALPKNFLPDEDQSEFQVTFDTTEGSTLAATLTVAERIARQIRAIPGVDATMTTVGGGYVPQATSASMLVKLVPIDQRAASQDEIMVQTRDLIAKVSAAYCCCTTGRFASSQAIMSPSRCCTLEKPSPSNSSSAMPARRPLRQYTIRPSLRADSISPRRSPSSS
jgi:HAE1 family hydrophobic/amphiphilic exporter-1